MPPDSSYFGPGFFRFLRDLAKNNNREWFTRNKDRYTRDVQEPSLRFIEDAGPRLQKFSANLVADPKPFGGSLSRIYRDIRFSPDKRPYRCDVGIHFWHRLATGPEHETPGLYLHLGPDERYAASGIWHPDATTLEKIRRAIVGRREEWRRVLRGEPNFEGEVYKRPPKGYDPAHPFIQDLMRKDFVATVPFKERDVVGPDFLERFLDACGSMDPLNRFLTKAVGLPW